MRKIRSWLLAAALICPAAMAEAPRLVLQITVDGLRHDFLERYADNFSRKGFNYLFDRGVVYDNALYLHANTETIVGHTTLATGATPAVHGMVGNVWYNADTGKLGYNIEDPEAPLLATRSNAGKGAQVDPAQLRAGSTGRSPRGILVPTFSDTLTLASHGKAKNFGISGKDRSAVAMAGQTGIAYWYSTDTGDFQTSSYYLDGYPAWVQAWNDQRKAESFSGASWTLMLEPDSYRPGRRDDRDYEVDLKGYGKTFPHAFGPSDHPLFFTRLLVSPEGDRLLLDFGKQLIEAEGIGQDNITDYLSISFSSVDAVNHFFGPASLENEDVVVQLDRTLADLFHFIDKKVGLKHTVIVMSADHGMAEMPEYATEMGHAAGRIYSDDVLTQARQTAASLFGNEDIVKDFFRPYLYLDQSVIEQDKLSRKKVARQLSQALSTNSEAAFIVSGKTQVSGGLDSARQAIAHNHHPQRSGDIYVFQPPYWFLFDRGPVAAMHGSPWRYDQHVPVIFAVPGIDASRVSRTVHPIDVAPTLSALLGLTPPAGSQGTVLPEVFSNSP